MASGQGQVQGLCIYLDGIITRGTGHSTSLALDGTVLLPPSCTHDAVDGMTQCKFRFTSTM